MSAITITVNDKSGERFGKLENALERFVNKASDRILGDLIVQKNMPKSGRIYGSHQASAPGESPATNSGNLYGSISKLVVNSLEHKIGTAVEYAAFLEHGTSRVAARPLFEPVAAAALPTLEGMLKAELKKAN